MFDRVYVEIGNICNLHCSFCPGTKRQKRQMTVEEFDVVCQKLKGFCEHLLFHVMGEPLLHPKLDDFLKKASEYGYKVSITTNGTLLGKCIDTLVNNANVLHRVSVSLHAPEGNGEKEISDYLMMVIDSAKKLTSCEVNTVYRLWNLDTEDKKGNNSENASILNHLKKEYKEEWIKRYSGYRLAYRTFLEFDGIFTWPSESDAEEENFGKCYALSRQIAILSDGTVVPCCLDSEGKIPLGNIFESSLKEILSTKVAVEMLRGFQERRFVHALCKKCTYARRFG